MNLHSAIFYTKNINTIVDFYTNILQFKLEHQNGDRYASFIFANNARLGIKQADADRETPGKQTVIVEVDADIESLHTMLKEKNIVFYKELTTAEWGKNFSILDIDGNKVEFVER